MSYIDIVLPILRTGRSRRLRLAAALALFVAFAPGMFGNAARAQESIGPQSAAGAWWVDFDIGDIEARRSLITLGIRGSWMPSDDELLSLRAVRGEEFRICVFGGCTPPDHITEISALYGRVMKRRWWYGAISAGIGWTEERTVWSDGTEENVATVGIPILGEIYFTPFQFVGIGASGFGNLNVEHPFAGIVFSLQVGNLKNQ